ncbi:MAG: KdsC family phosphatase [Phycisphaerae bacterium]
MTRIKLLILDVDGVLTSGALPYDASDDISKTFHVQDGTAVRLWHDTGGLAAIISGRQAEGVERRAKDLGINIVVQGVSDKLPAYDAVRSRADAEDDAVAVIGDDLLDLPLMRRCGYPIAVENAVPRVKRAARYVTRRRGGEGAIAEAVERLLRLNGTWHRVMERRG